MHWRKIAHLLDKSRNMIYKQKQGRNMIKQNTDFVHFIYCTNILNWPLNQWHTGIVRLTALWSNGIQASSDWQRSDPMTYRHQIDSTLAQWCWGSNGAAVIFQGDRATIVYNPVKM